MPTPPTSCSPRSTPPPGACTWASRRDRFRCPTPSGFIRDLPHGLISAFKATLQGAADADLLLHVVDAANPAHPQQIAQVQEVLAEIGAADVAQILVFNKVDALASSAQPLGSHDDYEWEGRRLERLFVSAHTGEGLAALRLALAAQAARAHGAQGEEPHATPALH